MPIIIKQPSGCTVQEIRGFATLVEAGGEVELSGLQERIDRAFLLGFATDDNEIVAVAAVKQPAQSHVRHVFTSSKTSLFADDYQFEYGWAFTTPARRGQHLAYRLLEGLLASTENRRIWASTRETNKIIQNVLRRSGFLQTGQPFRGRNENLLLWIRDLAPNEAVQPIADKAGSG